MVSGVVSKVRNALEKVQPQTLRDIGDIAKIALGVVQRTLQGAGRRSKITIPRVFALPKQRGILPLLPILGALGGVGSLAGGIKDTIWISFAKGWVRP